MHEILPIAEAGQLPLPGDNVAIAIRTLSAGTEIDAGEGRFRLSHTILEGHRFAIAPIAVGGPLLSWELPFGRALADIRPGDYVANEKLLADLRIRAPDFELPAGPNFRDERTAFTLNESTFQPGRQVEPIAEPRTFEGFDRGARRGSGTRNHIVILGTNSRTGAFARALAGRFRETGRGSGGFDGVAPVAHTEGGAGDRPNNLDIVLRTLAGFMVHPNVGAVLAVDDGGGYVTNERLRGFMQAGGYPLDDVPHRFLTLGGNRDDRAASQSSATHLDEAAAVIEGWLPEMVSLKRTSRPLSHLRLAQQCGGSDAFSGISGNPLSAWVAREIIRHGGAANLAETTELIGAESYILRNVRDVATARKFLWLMERYEELARWHGHSAEGNPSGGNLYRGLYNIIVKSIGAAMKKHPEVRLDEVLEYAERITGPGYHFMDSAGNDLESIAGQVASGCNLIHFVTGNGSITNFPFVPTVKIVTTTGRYELLSAEMDINAGRHLEGESLDALGREAFEHSLEIASGRRSAGEKAGHSQVQIWRDWKQTEPGHVEEILAVPAPTGEPIPVRDTGPDSMPDGACRIRLGRTIGLLAPTSLCSGQVANLIAARLDTEPPRGFTRFVSLAHTEGCGTSRGHAEELFLQTMAGYACHPFVRRALFLEHGCEKTHNAEFRCFLKRQGASPETFGWASIQLDGGIEKVSDKVCHWFGGASDGVGSDETAATVPLRVGVIVNSVSREASGKLARLVLRVVRAGGSVVFIENACVLREAEFTSRVPVRPDDLHRTLAYGQPIGSEGLHLMEAASQHPVEQQTGIGAAGVHCLLNAGFDRPLPAHPLIPSIDLAADPAHPETVEELVARIRAAVKHHPTPSQWADFQIARGPLGISL